MGINELYVAWKNEKTEKIMCLKKRVRWKPNSPAYVDLSEDKDEKLLYVPECMV